MDVGKSKRASQFDIVLEGWLQKKSKHINRWNRKWIILSTQSIYTYKNKETKGNASEILHLSDILSVKIDNTEHMFALIDENHSMFQFQCEHPLHTKQWILAITAYIQCIQIPIHVDCRRNVDYCCRFSLGIPYHTAYKYTVNDLLSTIVNRMQRNYPPIQFEPLQIIEDSFIAKHIEYGAYDWKQADIIITDYDKESVMQQGMHLLIDIALYHHRISPHRISCAHMNHNRNRMCPVYTKMKCNTLCTKDALHHARYYTHHHNPYADKQACKLDPCPAYQRAIHGGNALNDMCHITVYKHPPRNKHIQSAQNMKCFALNPAPPLAALYTPTMEDMIECVYNEQDGYLKTFIAEIIRNGGKKHLYLSNDDRFQNKDVYTVMNTVQDKLECIRHKQMGSPLNRSEMLSLILYTCTDCNASVCDAQRNGDYDKWKWFDYCLYNAVLKLSRRECGSYPVYTALKDVFTLECEFVERGYLNTYVSTSWVKEFALHHCMTEEDNACILFEIDGEFRENCICCDVSWISKFGSNECEVLLARSIDSEPNNCFECAISTELHLYLPHKIRTVRVLPLGATEERSKEIMKYPLMDFAAYEDDNDGILRVDILQYIDGVTEDIICGYLRMLIQQLPIPQRYEYNTVPVLIRASIALYYFNIYQPSTYLYPQYVTAHNLNAMLRSEPERVTKYPNIAFHDKTQQLVIGTTTAQDGHCMFLYRLDDITSADEIKLKSCKSHTAAITAVQFCHDASYVVSYSARASALTVWDIQDEEQQCIKQCPIESFNKTFPFALHLMHTKLTWTTDGVTLQLPGDQTVLNFPKLKTSKTHKCLIFIVEGMHKLRRSIFPLQQSSTGDGMTELLPITSSGIDEAYNLSRYLNKHCSIIRREQESADYEKESVEKPIQDALNVLTTDVLSPNNKHRDLLRSVSPELLSTCEELAAILEGANLKIQAFKEETSGGGTNSKTFGPLIDRQRTLIVSDYYKDMEEEDKKTALNGLESTLKLEWVLDQLISSANNSIVVSSNERRAISTAMIALWDRFERDKNEFIYLIPYLQQQAGGSGALYDPHASETPIATLSHFEKHCRKLDVDKVSTFYETRLVMEPSLQHMDMNRRQTLLEEDHDRFELFCDWIFEIMNDTIIICAHTDWFITFIKMYLSECANFSVAKTVANCSVCGFRMTRHVIPDGSTKYQIIERSITNVYRGFK